MAKIRIMVLFLLILFLKEAHIAQSNYRHSYGKIVPATGDNETLKFDTFAVEDSSWNVHVVIIPPQVAVRNFHVAGSPCTSQFGTLHTTSKFARQYHCNIAAMNGSPFGPDGACIGRAVSDGVSTCNNCSDEFIVSLGLTEDGTWMIGHNLTLSNPHLEFMQLLPGLDNKAWIIQDGQIYTDNNLVAPRSIIALMQNGTMVWFVVDGCEYCIFENYIGGMTLRQAAQTLIQRYPDVKHAINLDGGGSSTLVRGDEYKVWNHPTGYDVVPLKKERPISNIACLGYRNIS